MYSILVIPCNRLFGVYAGTARQGSNPDTQLARTARQIYTCTRRLTVPRSDTARHYRQFSSNECVKS